MKHKWLPATLCSVALISACSYDIDDKVGCFEGQMQCYPKTEILQRCHENAFEDEMDCAQNGKVCGQKEDGSVGCVFAPPALPCEGNAEDACSKDRLFRCKKGQWSLKQDCVEDDLICMPDAEGKAGCSPKCEEGAYRCQVNQIMACSESGRYTVIKTCAGRTMCEADGEQETMPACKCISGESYCDGDKQMICTKDGQYDEVDCNADGRKCVEDIPGAAVCTSTINDCVPGKKRCEEDGKLATCDDEGHWTASSCEGNQICVQEGTNPASCEPVGDECDVVHDGCPCDQPGGYACSQKNVDQALVCTKSDDGNKVWESYECVGCNMGAGSEPSCDGLIQPECQEAEKKCSDDHTKVLSCSDGTWSEMPCVEGWVCVDDFNQCKPKAYCPFNGATQLSNGIQCSGCSTDRTISSVMSNDDKITYDIATNGDMNICLVELNLNDTTICDNNKNYCLFEGAVYIKYQKNEYYYVGFCQAKELTNDSINNLSEMCSTIN